MLQEAAIDVDEVGAGRSATEWWRVVDGELCRLAKGQARNDAAIARWLRDADSIRIWEHLGYATMFEYAERRLGYAPRTAKDRLRVAHALADLPLIEEALADSDGRLHYSAARELTRVATPETEYAWIKAIEGKSLRQIERMVAGRSHGDLPDDPADSTDFREVLTFEIESDVFALIRQTRVVLQNEIGESLEDDAFLEILCRRALELVVKKGSSGPAYQKATIVECEKCKCVEQNAAGFRVDIDPVAAELAMCDADLIGCLDDDSPVRVTSTVTPRMRRHVFARDKDGCCVPGCRSARNLDLHHIEFQSHGGAHEAWNVCLCCSAHHRSLHAGKLVITGCAPELTFTRIPDDEAEAPARAAARDLKANAHAHVGTKSQPTDIKGNAIENRRN